MILHDKLNIGTTGSQVLEIVLEKIDGVETDRRLMVTSCSRRGIQAR